jgi:hypothetical protein
MNTFRKSAILRVSAVLAVLVPFAVPARAADHAPRSLAPYFTPATAAPKAPDQDGFLQRWLILEPISKPNRTNTPFTDSYVRAAFNHEYFPNQFAVIPRDGDKVKVHVPAPQPAGSGGFPFAPPGAATAGLGGGPSPRPPSPPAEPAPAAWVDEELAWHALDSAAFNVKLFRFAYGLNKQTYGVIFWAVTVVNSPREMRNVRLAVGSNAASMWWLNGKEAVSLFGDRRMVVDDAVSKRLTLTTGSNVIRGAVINGPGMSDFCVRFIDENGAPIKDLTLSIE